MISKLIPIIFKTTKCFLHEKGGPDVAYKGLAHRLEMSNSDTLKIPDNCPTAIEDNELVVTCWREYVIEDQHLKLHTKFGSESTELIVRDVCFNLIFVLKPTHRYVDGMVYLMERLQLCKGYLHIPSTTESSASVIETWSHIIHKGDIEKRVRSQNCKVILSMYSKVDYCQVCMEKAKRSKKRASLQIPPENPSSKLVKLDTNAQLTDLTNKTEIQQNTENCLQAAQGGNEQEINAVNTQEELIDKLISLGAPEKFKLFLEMQITNSRKDIDRRQRKWDPEFISFCLGVYVRSPRACRELRDSSMFVLPTESLLRMYKNCIRQKPSINEDNLM